MQDFVASSFLQSVEKYGAATAVVAADEAWTYGDLGQLAGAVARYLASLNLEKGARIALLLPNCGEYISIYYGIHLAGGVAVALNYQEPAAVIWNLLKHCQAEVLFVDRNYRFLGDLEKIADSSGPRVVPLTTGRSNDRRDDGSSWYRITEDSGNGVPLPVELVGIDDTDLAMIIYTSGTTGRPKGVTLSHRNLQANTRSILECLPVRQEDRCFNVLPFYYSFGNSILQTHVSAGACLILQNSIAFPHAVLKQMEAHAVHSFYGVPTTYALLFDSQRLKSVDLTSLRYIAQAGGPMLVPQQQQLSADLPGVEIYVMYGQTEASARLTCLHPAYLADKMGSVGRAIPGVELRVGDDVDSKHSAERPGQIYARGENIMVGYWDDGEATRKVLADGWLKTGDLGYFDHDGFLYVAGRSTDMIKTGANRVSPSEIEEIIKGIPEVSEVGACGIPDDVLGQAIAVAIVLRDDASLKVRDVQKVCLKSLTSYKVPKIIKFVASLPKTSTGKLQRHVLATQFTETEPDE